MSFDELEARWDNHQRAGKCMNEYLDGPMCPERATVLLMDWEDSSPWSEGFDGQPLCSKHGGQIVEESIDESGMTPLWLRDIQH